MMVDNDSSPMLQLARRRAASRLRQLVDEIQMLMVSFSDLRDAFDADELPIAFILKRDSQRLEPEFRGREAISASADDAADRRIRTTGGARHSGRPKQPSDD
jgi:glycine cleavage system aminomethyltransferase T